MMTAERRKPRKKGKSGYIRVGAGYADERKQRAKVRGNTGDGDKRREGEEPDGVLVPVRNPDTDRPRTFLASEAWVDAHFIECDDVGPDGEPILVRYFHRGAKASPLNGAATGQVRCEICGHLCPSVVLERGHCPDHRPERVHMAHGASPSAMAIQRIRELNAEPDDAEKAKDKRLLKPESKSALRREIKRFLKYRWKPLHAPLP